MSDSRPPPRRRDSLRLSLPLLVLAVAVSLASVVGVVWLGYEHLVLGHGSAATVRLLTVALLAGGLSAAAIMLGLAAVLHAARQSTLPPRPTDPRDQTDRNEGEQPSAAPVAAETPGTTTDVPRHINPHLLDETVRLLAEIAENSLLTDEQKQAKVKRRRDEERRATVGRIEQLIAKGDYHLADQAYREMVDRYGPDAELERVARRIEQARAEAEAKDLADARQEVGDLMSVSAWDRAERVAGKLVAKHPDSDQARELSAFVARERRTFEQQQRQRMRADIDRHVSRRQWQQALEVARRLIGRYADSPEAAAVRPRIETLEANAEIQERHLLEDQIKGLIKKHRFGEAADLARQLIQAYPDSPQAQVLRGQLDRLEEKAKKG